MRFLLKQTESKVKDKDLTPIFFSHMHEYVREMVQAMKEIGKTGPFWKDVQKLNRGKNNKPDAVDSK
ncbi:MAG: hypothetical protein KGZ49_06015 [Syntrophaceae bacterium]|nr:hypothetical protein [Syntrophaceae bacterium]